MPLDLAREFDAGAEHYDYLTGRNPGYHEHLQTAARELRQRLPRDQRVRLIDLGCGSGASTIAVVDEFDGDAAVLGVDASDGMLDVARRKQWPAGVRFAHGSADDLATRADEWRLDQPVDGVFACYLFRNVPDPDVTLRAVREVLAPGGWLVAQDYSVAGSRRARAVWTLVCWLIVIPLSLVVSRRTALYRYLWRSVLRFDSADRFARRLEAAGFDQVTHTTVDGWQHGILHTFAARRSSTP